MNSQVPSNISRETLRLAQQTSPEWQQASEAVRVATARHATAMETYNNSLENTTRTNSQREEIRNQLQNAHMELLEARVHLQDVTTSIINRIRAARTARAAPASGGSRTRKHRKTKQRKSKKTKVRRHRKAH